MYRCKYLLYAVMNSVPHALPGRNSTATDVHGMTGIPETARFGSLVNRS